MSIYMKIEGIDGDATAKGFEKWILLKSAHYEGINTPIKMLVGRTDNSVSSSPKFGEFNIIKAADNSSIGIFNSAHSAEMLRQVDIAFVTNGDQPQTLGQYTLTDVLVSSYRDGKHAEGSEILEHITLTYKTIEKTHITTDSSGNQGSPIRSGYNLREASKL